MTEARTSELRATLRLAAPIVAVQTGQIAMGVVDVLMVGHHSDAALAGIALGHIYVWGLLVFGYGVLTALDPVIAQAVGARDAAAVGAGLQRGIVLALLLGVPLTALGLPAASVFEALDQPAAVVPIAADYVHWSLPGFVPFLLFVVLRHTLQALTSVRPVLWTMLVANVLNAVLDHALIHGRLGAPELGLRGAAVASSIGRLWLACGLLWAGWTLLRPHLRRLEPGALDARRLRALFVLGLPLGLQALLEMGAFSATALFIGRFGEHELAGHKVALMLATLSFMVPVGISSAAAVRVGHAVGRSDPDGVRRAAATSIALGGAVMAVFGALFLGWPESLASLFTASPAVLTSAALLVPLAGLFQVFDGIQVVCIGVLRGLAETRTALWVNLVGFWCLGVPIGWALAHPGGLGPRGLWWGLVIGLACVAAALLARVARRLRAPLTGRVEPLAAGEVRPEGPLDPGLGPAGTP